MKRIASAAVIAALLTSACATAPGVYSVENTRVISESKDVVWERVVEFFATNNLSIKTIEKDSGIIAAERMVNSPAPSGSILGWADCGTNAMATPRSQMVDLNVFVRPQGAGTNVTVNTRFGETRFNAISSGMESVSCNSTGELEKLILGAASRP